MSTIVLVRHLRRYTFPVFRYQSLHPSLSRCHFSSDDKNSFKETLRKIEQDYKKKNDEGEASDDNSSSKSAENNSNSNDQYFANAAEIFSQISYRSRVAYDFIADNFRQSYVEMTGETKSTYLERRIEQAESYRKPKESSDINDEDKDDDVKGGNEDTASVPSALVLVKEPSSAWENMKNRLNDSPFIREMFKRSKQFRRAAAQTDAGQAAQKIGQTMKEKIETAREFWQTSQNPLVYTVSGIVDNLTRETEEGEALKEIRKLDPDFLKEDWALEVRHSLVPKVLQAFLLGDIASMKPWMSDGVYNKVAAEIRQRKGDGITFDPNILDIEENTTIIRMMEGEGPIIVVVYMVQQINCVRNKAGEIIEGGETQVVAKVYSIAFRQVYMEDEGYVKWKLIDLYMSDGMPYL